MSSLSKNVRKRRVRLKILAAQDGRCFYCTAKLSNTKSTTDHVIPISKGGTNEQSNMVVACKPCNNAKGDRTGAEFLSYLQADFCRP